MNAIKPGVLVLVQRSSGATQLARVKETRDDVTPPIASVTWWDDVKNKEVGKVVDQADLQLCPFWW